MAPTGFSAVSADTAEGEMRRLGGWMAQALRAPQDTALAERLLADVRALCRGFPVPGVAHA